MAPGVVFSATYSNVDVYEYIVDGVAMMRRKNDGWLNATQILKIAGFDKPQRTRILEREIQTGTHEKVQGGYGKYQGTWIPLEVGAELCHKYEIYGKTSPIIEFVPGDKTPPQAPKHARNKPVRSSNQLAAGARGAARGAASSNALLSGGPAGPHGSGGPGGGRVSSATAAAASAPPPPPLRVAAATTPSPGEVSFTPSRSQQLAARRPYMEADADFASASSASASPPPRLNSPGGAADGLADRKRRYSDMQATARLDKYSEALLAFFMDPTPDPPAFLLDPPADFDVNAVLDDEEHTALHWACAMGHLRVVMLLLQAGADITAVNHVGQTALMRSVLFTNNYDLKTFGRLAEILHQTVFMVDNYGQNVFHECASITYSTRKLPAARYYIDTLLAMLSNTFPAESVLRLLNLPDPEGDTPLLICARNSARRCVKPLLAYGANPNIVNKQGRTAAEYIQEDERQRRNQPNANPASSSPSAPPGGAPLGHSEHGAHDAATNGAGGAGGSGWPPAPHLSETAIMAVQKTSNDMVKHLESLAQAYDEELADKDADDAQALELLETTLREADALRAKLADLTKDDDETIANLQVEGIKHAEHTAQVLAAELKRVLERSQAKDLAHLVHEQESKIERRDFEAQYSQQEQQELAARLTKLQAMRRQRVDHLVELFAAAGTGTRMSDYRRLIAMSCGMSAEFVDGTVIEAISEELKNEAQLNDGGYMAPTPKA